MNSAELKEMFTPVLGDIRERSAVVERFVDRNLYQVYLTTLWSNVVLSPEEVGIEEGDLEALHDLLNEEISAVLGGGASLTSAFEFINSKQGEAAMKDAQLTSSHKDLLLYFASMILDPQGHKRWIDDIRERESKRRL